MADFHRDLDTASASNPLKLTRLQSSVLSTEAAEGIRNKYEEEPVFGHVPHFGPQERWDVLQPTDTY